MDNLTAIIGFHNNTGFVIDSNIYLISAFFHLASSVASLFGNSLVIISVIKFTYLRYTTHALVVLLACFDLGFGVVELIEQCALILNVYRGELEGMRTFCLIMAVLLSGMGTGNLITAMFIAIDRFIYISYPFTYPDVVTRNKMIFVVVFTMLYSLVTSTIWAFMTGSVKGHIVCNLIQIISQFSNYYFIYVEGTIVGLVFITFYGKIAFLACRKAQYSPEENTQNHISGENNSRQQQLKVTRVLSLVIGVFIATNMCLAITFIFFTDTESTTVTIVQLVAEWIWKVRILIIFS